MKNVLELFSEQPNPQYGDDSQFMRMVRIRNEHMDMFNATLTEEQKDLLEAYAESDVKISGIKNFEQFRYAFHLGAQMMAEMLRGKEELLK